MKIACAFDHAGFPLKALVLETVAAPATRSSTSGRGRPSRSTTRTRRGWRARRCAAASAERGVIVCGSGAGVAVAACKFPGIRAAVAHDTYTAHQCVEHDECNVLCLGGRVIGPALAAEVIPAYLGAPVLRRGASHAEARRRSTRSSASSCETT